jgi:hypothetical protein
MCIYHVVERARDDAPRVLFADAWLPRGRPRRMSLALAARCTPREHLVDQLDRAVDQPACVRQCVDHLVCANVSERLVQPAHHGFAVRVVAIRQQYMSPSVSASVRAGRASHLDVRHPQLHRRVVDAADHLSFLAQRAQLIARAPLPSSLHVCPQAWPLRLCVRPDEPLHGRRVDLDVLV